jgi:5-carboxymethyl-2-hydroxymuconate isomerase
MPHIHLEATPNAIANTDVILVLRQLTGKLSSFESIDPASVKSYYTERPTYLMGDGAQKGFVHCTVAIVSGRPPELKDSIARGMMEVLEHWFGRKKELRQASITLELREMDRETYQK